MFQIIFFYEKDISAVLNICKLQQLKFMKVTKVIGQPITKEKEITSCVEEAVMSDHLLTMTKKENSIKKSNHPKILLPYLD